MDCALVNDDSIDAVHALCTAATRLAGRNVRAMSKRTVFTDIKRAAGEAVWIREDLSAHDYLDVRRLSSAVSVVHEVGVRPDLLCTRAGLTLGQLILAQSKVPTPPGGASQRRA
jgi:hypothetical protein